MPKDNIERAIARGAGNSAGEQMESALYEALMLDGRCALLIECLTDNKNPITFSGEEQKKINEIVDLLEEEDDVQKIWTNSEK